MTKSLRKQIADAFTYKAEELNQDIFGLYTEPRYFSEIIGNGNCVLIGGRGTGKTTVLKGISYQGQVKLNTNQAIQDWPYYGLYYKVDSARVSAFGGLGLSPEQWKRPFSHYINLILAGLVTDFLCWYSEQVGVELVINSDSQANFKEALQIKKFNNVKELKKNIDIEISKFGNYINNLGRNTTYNFSLLGAPVDSLFEYLSELLQFKGKKFYFLIDEYESYSDYQQQVVNTLIKEAAGKPFCFKLGVKELGWRNRLTLNQQELRSPSDYRKIDINEEFKTGFKKFAEEICNNRLRRLSVGSNLDAQLSVSALLPGLNNADEAVELGVKERIDELSLTNKQKEVVENLEPLFIWFLHVWAESHKISFDEILSEYSKNNRQWVLRYNNYKYTTLFTIRARKRGNRKLYSGWNTLVLLSAANIRFALQLVEASLIEHLNDGNKELGPVNPENQTNAAIRVAKNNFDELEGIDVRGHQIMSLVQGLGRLFEIYAKSLIHAPEVNQFWIVDRVTSVLSTTKSEAKSIIDLSISNLAISRNISNKLSNTDPKSYDYSLHPIFSPLFMFSHRRKRKLNLTSIDIINLIENQGKTIIHLSSDVEVNTDVPAEIIHKPVKINKVAKPVNNDVPPGEQLFLF